MSEIKYKTHILTSIDHLRARKARPDIDRICNFMLKKFKVSSKETKADLKKCIKARAVCQVDYKGDVSYRNAANWRLELKHATEKNNKMKTEKRMMTTAMAELIFSDPDYLEQGVPPSKLIKAMATKENAAYNKKSFEAIIHRELQNGGLVKMENGNYTLGAGEGDQDSMEMDSFNADSNTKMTSSNNSSSTSSPLRVKGKPGRKKGSINKLMNHSNVFARADVKKLTGIRVGERHKRAKKVFDPSDNNVPVKKKRGRPVGSLNKASIKKHISVNTPTNVKNILERQKVKSESGDSTEEEDTETRESNSVKLENKVTGGVCSVCRQHKNPKDNSGKLVSCRDCSNRAHPSCLRGDGMLRLRPDNTWQCPHCKTCVVCIETNDAGILTVCNVCADAYHALCHSPPIPERLKAWDQWECRNCLDTKTTGHHMDASYIEKLPPGSDHSSKNSDRSDSRKSSMDRRRDKSSVKSIDSDDRNENKLVIAEKDDHSYSPTSLDNNEWKFSRRLVSPARNSVFEWKQSDGKASDADSKRSKSTLNDDKSKVKPKSIYMDYHEQNKLRNVATFQKHPHDRSDDGFDPSIPNAENWNYSDVYQYFSSYFPEEAHVFKEQEIDGKSLLMMRRNDVINSFGLPLGPALKLYRHVVKLQSRKDDFTMCWL